MNAVPTMPTDPPRRYPHDVRTLHPDYAPPKDPTMPANPTEQILEAQREILRHLREGEKRSVEAVTRADLEKLGSIVVRSINELRTDVEDLREEVDERFSGISSRVAALEGRSRPSPLPHRARIPIPTSPPKSAEEIGLKPTESGTEWRVSDAESLVRAWNEREAHAEGAEEALEQLRVESARKDAVSDRRLKRLVGWATLASLVFGGVIAAVTYALTHVSIH